MAKRSAAAGGHTPSPKKTKTDGGEAASALPASLESEPSVQELLLAQSTLERQLKAKLFAEFSTRTYRRFLHCFLFQV